MRSVLGLHLGLRYGARRALRKFALLLCLVPLPGFAEQITVAALGDSLTQGYGLRPEAGFVAQLGAWLDENGAGVDLINAGVSGDTTAGGLARVDWTLAGDVDAMIVALGGNDALRGLDPEMMRRNLSGILDAADGAGVPVLLIGIRAPANYGPDYKAAFEAVFPDLAAEYDTLYHPDFLQAVSDGVSLQSALDRYFQPDGLHPNAEGVRRIVGDIGPRVLDLAERARD